MQELFVMQINGVVQGVFPSLEEAAMAFENVVLDLPDGLKLTADQAARRGFDHIECRIIRCRYAKLPDGRKTFVNDGDEVVTRITFDGKQIAPPKGSSVALGPSDDEEGLPMAVDKKHLN